MKIGFIGDIVGRPGRAMVRKHLQELRETEGLDFVIGNYENASHGFGLTEKNAQELFKAGIDVMTGGNHTWDKKEIKGMLESLPLLRPVNYPEGVPGRGVRIFEVGGERLAVVNIMGHFAMPMVDNPFIAANRIVDVLRSEGIGHIFIDMHAEATSEKRALLMMLREKVSAIVGTHTHVGTDDLVIDKGCAYVTDVGLTGCRDNVIGMDARVPIERFLTGLPGRFDVPDKCKAILQMAVVRLEKGRAADAYKIRVYSEGDREIALRARIED
ncbi:TIGR00282 family metallophosphoesterase [Hydrogenimonas cancrithermarum]|uniref:Metallophosphoesterase n=1 Tax=Hydrogenimonas cancrithermarum TaxID=2993563 RepID=A0ABM8FNN1_9BACT|nr:TIGR00282 family metallophosphoesterase [Hydrogenimonas cancrithermarum]BDY13392.1 metallophosphoesterase [Hydrogenimonas cancrithermarum]